MWEGFGYDVVPPAAVFYGLRVLMFVLSFILEDWALHELVHVPRERRVATILVASSYVTWTFQTHTFSNSIETLIVLWCLVLVGRITEDKVRDCPDPLDLSEHMLIFSAEEFSSTRICGPRLPHCSRHFQPHNVPSVPTDTPCFLVGAFPPKVSRVYFSFRLLLTRLSRPMALLVMIFSGLATLIFAVIMDTEFYTNQRVQLRQLHTTAVITPWNNFIYNLDSTNLAKHGLHPYYQHVAANLPQILGPALPLVLFLHRRTMALASACCGIAVLSCFKHQEARFLLPAVPLMLSSVKLPQRMKRAWMASWIIFNACLGILMGVYHQGGVVPAQLWVGTQEDISRAFWWKTYSPPTYLLGNNMTEVVTTDFMGMRGDLMVEELSKHTECGASSTTLLLAPLSATFLDQFLVDNTETSRLAPIVLEEAWRYSNHLNLDDMEFGDDGVWPTISRVVGRRGIGAWRVQKHC